MNEMERLEALLPDRLADLGGSPSDYLGDILGRTARTRQRPAWTFPGRWFPMLSHSPSRAMARPLPPRTVWLLLMIGLLSAALVGGALVVGTRGLLGPNDGHDPLSAAAMLPTGCDPEVPLASGFIATVAGTGGIVSSGDGGPALQAGLYTLYTIPAVDSRGAVYFFDRTAAEIRRVDTDGSIEAYPGPPGMFGNAVGLAMGPGDALFVGEYASSRISKVDPAGSVEVVAGTGAHGWSGVGGPATEADISLTQLAIGPDGSLYFDGGPGFAMVDPQGILHAFAGTGTSGFSGDGGPASNAQLSDELEGVAADKGGSVYLGDAGNHRIRKVGPDGTITTFAGNGTSGWAGDGGRATEASLGEPRGIAVTDDATVYFADPVTSTVRRIGTDGIITTVAGTGTAGYSGDCGPGTDAQLSAPYGVAVRDGVLYIMDEGNSRIRMVVP